MGKRKVEMVEDGLGWEREERGKKKGERKKREWKRKERGKIRGRR